MKCDCINRIEENLTAMTEQQIGSGQEITSRLEVMWGMSDEGIDEMLFINAKIEANAKGYTKGKKQKIVVSFCPFCGVDQRAKVPA
jgi:hypothetical protein